MIFGYTAMFVCITILFCYLFNEINKIKNTLQKTESLYNSLKQSVNDLYSQVRLNEQLVYSINNVVKEQTSILSKLLKDNTSNIEKVWAVSTWEEDRSPATHIFNNEAAANKYYEKMYKITGGWDISIDEYRVFSDISDTD